MQYALAFEQLQVLAVSVHANVETFLIDLINKAVVVVHNDITLACNHHTEVHFITCLNDGLKVFLADIPTVYNLLTNVAVSPIGSEIPVDEMFYLLQVVDKLRGGALLRYRIGVLCAWLR